MNVAPPVQIAWWVGQGQINSASGLLVNDSDTLRLYGFGGTPRLMADVFPARFAYAYLKTR